MLQNYEQLDLGQKPIGSPELQVHDATQEWIELDRIKRG